MATLHLERLDGKNKFQITDQSGNNIIADSKSEGKPEGMSPMEMLLAATAACSGIDVVMILEKQRQKLDDIKVNIEGKKVSVGTYSEWKNMHMHFDLYGTIKEKKAQQALDLSIQKYCSVAMVMGKTTDITYSYTIHPRGEQEEQK